jgi:agmatinase
MTQYRSSRHLEFAQREGDEVVLVHLLLGSRLRLNKAAQRFLELFQEPRSLEELAQLGSLEKARPIFEQMRKAGFLVEAGHEENISDKVLQPVARGFFGCPALSVREELRKLDIIFAGAPFDYGNHKDPGARFGPEALRQVSTEFGYSEDPATSRAAGWYDNQLGRGILRGAAMADAGNLFVAPNEDPRHVFGKLQEVASRILRAGALPVVIGGDHSITYSVVAAYDRPVALFHIDAHSDLAPYHPGIENHHGNVMSRVLRLEQVRGLYQVGIRGMTPLSQMVPSPKRPMALSPRQLRTLGVEGLLALLPEELDYYVSLDIDALDPSIAPGTSTPVPGGLGFEETKDLLIAVGRHRRCVGMDLVELNPRKDVQALTAWLGAELLMAFLGAWFEQREARHE